MKNILRRHWRNVFEKQASKYLDMVEADEECACVGMEGQGQTGLRVGQIRVTRLAELLLHCCAIVYVHWANLKK
jgi:hypothetical protein